MQWADVIAKSLLEKGRKHLLSTGSALLATYTSVA